MLEEDYDDEPEKARVPDDIVPQKKENIKSQESDKKHTQIITKVFDKLGKPKDLMKYFVRNIYQNRYRVNIIRKDPDQTLCFEAGKITDSFFIQLSQDGEIVYSNPEIIRRY